jgi:hypothetical protein
MSVFVDADDFGSTQQWPVERGPSLYCCERLRQDIQCKTSVLLKVVGEKAAFAVSLTDVHRAVAMYV